MTNCGCGAACAAHRELGLGELTVTAFRRGGQGGGVSRLAEVPGDGADGNRKIFGFGLEPGTWIIEVAATERSFANYAGQGDWEPLIIVQKLQLMLL